MLALAQAHRVSRPGRWGNKLCLVSGILPFRDTKLAVTVFLAYTFRAIQQGVSMAIHVQPTCVALVQADAPRRRRSMSNSQSRLQPVLILAVAMILSTTAVHGQ